MRKSWWLHGLKLVLFVVAAVLVLGAVVMGLWNWLMPDLLGLADDRPLAGHRTAGAEQDPARRSAWQASWHALGASAWAMRWDHMSDDERAKVQRRHAAPLRARRGEDRCVFVGQRASGGHVRTINGLGASPKPLIPRRITGSAAARDRPRAC